MMKNIKPAIALRIATVFVVVLAMLAIGFTPPQAGAQKINKKAAAAKKAERAEKRKVAKGKKASQVFLIKLNANKFETVKKLLKTPKLPNGKAAQAFIKEYLGLKVLATLGKSSPDLKFTFIVRLPSNVKNESIQARLKKLKAQELLEFSADVVGTGTDALAPQDLPEDVQINATMAFLGSRAKKAAGKDVEVRANAAPEGAGWVAVPLDSKNPSLLGAIVGLNKTWKKIKKGNPGNPQNGSVQISLATWEGLDKLGEGDTKNVLVWETLKTLLCAAQKDMVAIGAVGSKEKGYFPLPLVPVCAAKKLAKPEGVLGLSAGLVAKIGGEGKADSKREAGALNGYTVSGNVIDETGKGLGNVQLVLKNAGTTVSCSTNRSGNYTCGPVADGDYTITPSKDGEFDFVPPNRPVTVTGANVSEINFQADPIGVKVTGIVRGLIGTDTAGVCVYKAGVKDKCVSTNGGDYTINGLKRGRYRIMVENTTPDRYKMGRKSKKGIRIKARDRVVNLLVTPQKVRISGTVWKQETGGRPQKGMGSVIVRVVTTDGNDSNYGCNNGIQAGRAKTNRRGRYRVRVLKEEMYNICVSKGDNTFNRENWNPGGSGQAPFYDIKPQANVSGLDFIHNEAKRSISGKVTGVVDANDYAGITVTLTGGSTANPVGPNGDYIFNNVERGTYTVKVTDAPGKYDKSKASRSVVVRGRALSGINLPLAVKSYKVTGKVTKDGRKNPVGGATVKAEATDRAALTATTNPLGLYTISGLIHGGDYTLSATKAPHVFGPYTLNNGQVEPWDGKIANVSGNYSDRNFDSDQKYKIIGKVTGLEGSGNCQNDQDNCGKIVVKYKDQNGNTAEQGNTGLIHNGNFTISDVPNGTYTITAEFNERYKINPAQRVKTISNANATDINFAAEWKTYKLTGNVKHTAKSGGTGIPDTEVEAKAADPNAHPIKTANTSGSGAYQLELKHGVTYTVTPTRIRYRFGPLNERVTLTANGVRDFTGFRKNTVSGRVMTQGGAGIGDVTVTAKDAANNTFTTKTVAADGSYSFALQNGLEEGDWTITAAKGGANYMSQQEPVPYQATQNNGLTYTVSLTNQDKDKVHFKQMHKITGAINCPNGGNLNLNGTALKDEAKNVTCEINTVGKTYECTLLRNAMYNLASTAGCTHLNPLNVNVNGEDMQGQDITVSAGQCGCAQ